MSTQRTINRSLVVHNDFAIGFGNIQQNRGELTTNEQKIELTWIFRLLDEIRYLDITKYTRVALHTEGPLIQYYFDSTSTDSDDGDNVLAPIPPITTGRWIKVTSVITNFASPNLSNITDPVNTSLVKQAGYMVWSSTLNKPVWAVGSSDSDDWVDANGTVVYTPS